MERSESLQTQTVDILKQRFKLSGNLIKALKTIINPDFAARTLIAESSRQVMLDPNAQVSAEIAELERRFLRHDQAVYLDGRIEETPEGLAIFPRAQRQFNELAHLVDSLPDLSRQERDMDHHLIISLAHASTSLELWGSADAYASRVTDPREGRLHSVSPLGFWVDEKQEAVILPKIVPSNGPKPADPTTAPSRTLREVS